MTPDITFIRRKAIPILKRANVRRSALFGSHARGETNNTSDIDLLVDIPRGKSLLDLIRLKSDLEKSLRRKVDIITYKSVSHHLKSRIEKDTIPVL